MSYALVAGFHVDDQKKCKKTEMMNVNGTTKICHSKTNYPEQVYYVSGGSFINNNTILVSCGGSPLTSACYSMSNDLKWTNFANLTNAAEDAASVIVKNGLWVTGMRERFSLY